MTLSVGWLISKLCTFQFIGESNSRLLWFCFALWVFDKTHNIFSTNRQLRALFPALGADWFTEVSASLVIGQSNCFAFGFRTLIWNWLLWLIITFDCSPSCTCRIFWCSDHWWKTSIWRQAIHHWYVFMIRQLMWIAIEGVRTSDQWPYSFTETKETVCIKIEF